MFSIRTLSCALAVSLTAGSALAQSVREDFEAAPVGDLPGGEWLDAADRVEGHETLPTVFVIETTDALGLPTRAVQTRDVFGNSQGLLRPIESVAVQTVSVDVRVDRYGNGSSWPMGVGFTLNDGAPDINQSPQGLVYAWTDRQWHMFVALGIGQQGQDFIITGPPIVDGRWYRLTFTVNHETNYFEAIIEDAATNTPIAGRGVTIPWWTSSFDTITLFDGDIANTGSVATVATIDNVAYEPRNAICPGDCDFSNSIEFNDLVNMLTRFGSTIPQSCDSDGDGVIGFEDLVTTLFAFGACD